MIDEAYLLDLGVADLLGDGAQVLDNGLHSKLNSAAQVLGVEPRRETNNCMGKHCVAPRVSGRPDHGQRAKTANS